MKKTVFITLLVAAAGLIASEVNAQPPWAPAWGKRRKQQGVYRRYDTNNYPGPDGRGSTFPYPGIDRNDRRYDPPFGNGRYNKHHKRQDDQGENEDDDDRYEHGDRHRHGDWTRRRGHYDEDEDNGKYDRRSGGWNWPESRGHRHEKDEDDDRYERRNREWTGMGNHRRHHEEHEHEDHDD